ncbi:WhiB family transcriptional regulator [Streptomyces sp. NPDC004589]|uniref:WhiB family transcriptional regulator n=1 Tax=Streptomyces sp. NPDC004589 TaxID=3154553 RepID=UPI0033AA8469
MSRSTRALEADPRIPFPHTDTALACRTHPHLFVHEHGQTSPDDLAHIERARKACSGCPIADGCLKWALANPHLTPSGIWAATTARQRTTLRHRLQIRLGADWVGVVAHTDHARARQARSQAPDPAPPAHPMWTSRYEPWRQPVTPDQQQRNREALDLAQCTTRTPRPAPSAVTLEASA